MSFQRPWVLRINGRQTRRYSTEERARAASILLDGSSITLFHEPDSGRGHFIAHLR